VGPNGRAQTLEGQKRRREMTLQRLANLPFFIPLAYHSRTNNQQA